MLPIRNSDPPTKPIPRRIANLAPKRSIRAPTSKPKTGATTEKPKNIPVVTCWREK